MMRMRSAKPAQLATVLCLLAAGALLFFLLQAVCGNVALNGLNGQGTRLAFKTTSPEGRGFSHNALLYTEDGMTSVVFSGKLTVTGSAQITVTANEDGSVVQQESYTQQKAEAVRFTVEGLQPYAYYTLSFTSQDATKGQLVLTASQSLAKRPPTPQRPARSK